MISKNSWTNSSVSRLVWKSRRFESQPTNFICTYIVQGDYFHVIVFPIEYYLLFIFVYSVIISFYFIDVSTHALSITIPVVVSMYTFTHP